MVGLSHGIKSIEHETRKHAMRMQVADGGLFTEISEQIRRICGETLM